MTATLQPSHGTNDAASFLINRTNLGDFLRYDRGRDRMVDGSARDDEAERIKQIWENANEEMESLIKAMGKYQDKMAKKADANANCGKLPHANWDQVFSEVRKASNQYENEKMTGPKGAVKKALRKLKEHYGVMKQWCNLLPGGDYGTVIAGAFQMVVTAADRLDEVGERVFEAIGDIPDYMSHAQDYIEIYSIDQQDAIQKLSAELCGAVLLVLRKVFEFLTHSSAGRAARSFAKGEDFEKGLEKSIANVKRLANKIQNEAKRCFHQRFRRLELDARKSFETIGSIEERLSEHTKQREELGQLLYVLLSSNANFKLKPGKLWELESKEVEAEPRQESDSPPQIARGTSDRILEVLDYDPRQSSRDIRKCRKLQNTLNPRDKDESSWVVHSEELQLWLASPRSRDLLINGNRYDEALDETSPLSLVCAELAALCALSKDSVVTSYFCGLHADFDGDSVVGMIKSLIGQIISQDKAKELDLDLSWINEKDQHKMEKGDLRCLRQVFKSLVCQLPERCMFFCILDGISLFELLEDGENNGDTYDFLKMMSKLVRRTKNLAVVKLLLTCPGDSLHVGNEDVENSISVREVLNVPETVDGDRQDVWDTEDLEESVLSLHC